MPTAIKNGDAVTVLKDGVVYYTHVATASADKFNWCFAAADKNANPPRPNAVMADCSLGDENMTWLRGHVSPGALDGK